MIAQKRTPGRDTTSSLISRTTGLEILPLLSATYIIGCFLQKESLTKSTSPAFVSRRCDSAEEFIFESICCSPSFFHVRSPCLLMDSRFETSVKWNSDFTPLSWRVLMLLQCGWLRWCFDVSFRLRRALHSAPRSAFYNDQVLTVRPGKVVVCLIDRVRAPNNDCGQPFAQSVGLRRRKAKTNKSFVR